MRPPIGRQGLIWVYRWRWFTFSFYVFKFWFYYGLRLSKSSSLTVTVHHLPDFSLTSSTVINLVSSFISTASVLIPVLFSTCNLLLVSCCSAKWFRYFYTEIKIYLVRIVKLLKIMRKRMKDKTWFQLHKFSFHWSGWKRIEIYLDSPIEGDCLSNKSVAFDWAKESWYCFHFLRPINSSATLSNPVYGHRMLHAFRWFNRCVINAIRRNNKKKTSALLEYQRINYNLMFMFKLMDWTVNRKVVDVGYKTNWFSMTYTLMIRLTNVNLCLIRVLSSFRIHFLREA